MTKDIIIQNIKALKSHSNINYGIKTKTEDFTEKLFYTLFDSNADLEESIDELEICFKEIAVLACKKPQNSCSSIWDRFLEKLPRVLEKLNQDAAYILENDPASNSIDEVY
ncbi:MAG: serine acetyltransferase, partial [Flavobacterium sp.]